MERSAEAKSSRLAFRVPLAVPFDRSSRPCDQNAAKFLQDAEGRDTADGKTGLRFDEGIADVAAKYKTALVLMHLRGELPQNWLLILL